MKQLRVFQVITRMVRGGAQRVVVELLRRLPREEFHQTLVCGTGAASDGSLLPEARAAASEILILPDLVREVRPRSDARAVTKLFLFFESQRPDVVHAHTYKAGVVASTAARLADIPAVVFTPHGHIFAPGAAIPGVPRGGWKLSLLRWVTRAAQACAHRVTALSETDLRDQIALGLSPPSKYRIVRNGIDVDRFQGPEPRSFGESPVIGAVGRFTAEKGYGTLIEAFARVRSRLPGARLVLVGFGELEQALRDRARALGLDAAVTFAGERDSAEVLPSFDLFVQPSLYESQGLAILEAMAAGRPVIATDVGGVGDAVRDGETGVLARAGDPAALAEAILRLAGDPATAARLAARARAEVRERFSVDRMAVEYARLYKELTGRYNPRRCTTTSPAV